MEAAKVSVSRIGNCMRFADIAALLEQIILKFNGRSNLAFLVLVTVQLSEYEPAAVTVALLEVLHSSKPDCWDGHYPAYGTIRSKVENALMAQCCQESLGLTEFQDFRMPFPLPEDMEEMVRLLYALTATRYPNRARPAMETVESCLREWEELAMRFGLE